MTEGKRVGLLRGKDCVGRVLYFGVKEPVREFVFDGHVWCRHVS